MAPRTREDRSMLRSNANCNRNFSPSNLVYHDNKDMAPLTPARPPSCNSVVGSMDFFDRMTLPLASSGSAEENEDYMETDFGETDLNPKATRVKFAVAIKRYEVLAIDDFSEKEIKKSWYTTEEKQKMQAKKNKIVERIERARPPKKGMTYRGLECWTTKGGEEIHASITAVIDAVIDEQDVQWAREVDDDERIAAVSRQATRQSTIRARELAIEDEREAREAWEMPVEDCPTDDDLSSSMAHKAAMKRAERMEKRLKSREQRHKRKNRRKKRSSGSSSTRSRSDPPGFKMKKIPSVSSVH